MLLNVEMGLCDSFFFVRCECIKICYTEAIEYLFQGPLMKVFLKFRLPLCFPELSRFKV